MLSILLSFLTSSTLRKFLPYILAAVAVLGVFWYTYHLGYTSAANECRAAQIQAELDAERIRNKSLQDQLDSGVKVVEELRARKDQVQIVTREVVKRINILVPDVRACDVNTDVINEINKARAGK